MSTNVKDAPASEPQSRPVSAPGHLIERERQVLRDLVQLAAARAAGERETEATFQAGITAAEAKYQEVSQRIGENYKVARADMEAEYQKIRESIGTRFDAERLAAENEVADARRRITSVFRSDSEALETSYQEARWTAHTLFEATKTKADGQLQEAQRKIAVQRQKIAALGEDAARILGRWLREEAPLPLGRGSEEGDAPRAPGATFEKEVDPLGSLKERVADVEDHLNRAANLMILKFVKGKRLAVLCGLLWVLAAAPALWAPVWYYWLAAATVGAAVAAAVLHIALRLIARNRVNLVYHPLCQLRAEAEALCEYCLELFQANHQRQLAKNQERYDANIRQVEERYQRKTTEIAQRRDSESRQAEEKYQKKTAEVTSDRDSGLRLAEDKYPRLLTEMKQRYEYDSFHAFDHYQHQLTDSKTAHKQAWDALSRHWQQGMARVQAAVADITLESRRLFPDWSGSAWSGWQPPTVLPPAIRFGEFQVPMAEIPEGVPQDERLKNFVPAVFPLPALLSFPDRCSLLFKASDRGRALAEQTMQTIMLRLLTAAPPGKVRFTIIDPVGLGQSFAAFMHLADHDEMLVSSRIWTEQPHIEQRLADLTAHMENVIQKFLRNQFETIEEYNRHAGEVAEPFRFLVVANFPTNFSSEAARRLVSIASSGARCGVHTLITVDTKQPLPQGFSMKDLDRCAVNVLWKADRFAWKDPDFGKFPFQLDAPPDPDFATRVLQVVGAKAKEAARVEVPFEFIAPPPDQWWTSDSRPGIRVALGRSGATKRQMLNLGQGTAQHVLIAGKTGSGKSTLLHALITNLSLLYSPDEVELYLVDFKEGVEFKPYATHELPHARVVAIESEREFGLSVLQRLDAELRDRGDRFRALGVQDLSSYRQANGSAPLPRILLIVDEFQLFFIEDDRIGQDAALLLDRLVRQGRAFGIHVLLGSQTLGGAYSLARSTIGQMAVRIALQCSEADAHLILSDDNPAARLLSRPGEAIYNDANGLVEGNDFFQVVWLPDSQKEDYLSRIQELAQRRHVQPPPQIVFEGNAPADVRKNHLLQEVLESPTWPTVPREALAWLGEAMAIKDATAAIFRPLSGSNLLIVGQSEEAALGILGVSLISLAAQHAPPLETEGPGGGRFFVLDAGTPASLWPQIARVLPNPVRLAGWRDLPAVLGGLAEDVERRQKVHEGDLPPRFLFIHGLQRFRDLRKADDDFSFSRRDEDRPPAPAKLFQTILRDGPSVGIYTLVWCDTPNNVNRALDRQGLREFEMRVLFQMSAADSSNLIDSPVASKLGTHRALFYTEERGQPEKFRPYGLPTDEWLAWVRDQMGKKKLS
jgi:hypothetical protein